MNFLIFSHHSYQSKNKAGFHFITNELVNQDNNQVIFVSATTGLINLQKAYKRGFSQKAKLNQLIQLKNNLFEFNLCTVLPLISYRNKYLDWLLLPILLLQYKVFLRLLLGKIIKQTDVIIFESIPLIELVAYIRHLNPKLRLVYRVSDLFESVPKCPAWIIKHEKNLINFFDIISVPSFYMYQYYSKLLESPQKLQLDYHGIDRKVFDQNYSNPYLNDSINAVWCGISGYDSNVVTILAQNFPQIKFHIIGFVQTNLLPNIINYGVMNFSDTIRYIKFADIGLATAVYLKGREASSDSLKIKQYTYCKLPVIAPQFMHYYQGNNMFFYESNIASIVNAFEQCLSFKRDTTDISNIYNWLTVTNNILKKIIVK